MPVRYSCLSKVLEAFGKIFENMNGYPTENIMVGKLSGLVTICTKPHVDCSFSYGENVF